MDFNEYQKEALKTAFFNDITDNVGYLALAMAGETGEVCEKIKKIMRDKGGIVSREDRDAIKKELGDVLWYMSVLAYKCRISLDDVAAWSIEDWLSRTMDFSEYQDKARKIATFSDNVGWLALATVGRVGKVCEKIEKIMCDEGGIVFSKDEQVIQARLGDVLLYMSVLASKFGISLEDVAVGNIEKLKSRQERGVLQGEGDNR